MEVYAEHGDKSDNLHSGEQKIHTKEKQMEELNVNLEQAANYLIQLFYKTEQRYSCTRTKIGKLLSIVAFVYAKENKQLFNENIYKYNGCGSSINELKLFLDREIYMRDSYSDDENLFEGNLNDVVIPEEYRQIDEIDNDVKQRIEAVFRRFASFPPAILGQCINPIVEYDGITEVTDKIILSVFPTLQRACFQSEYENETLLDYIFGLEQEDTDGVGVGNA